MTNQMDWDAFGERDDVKELMKVHTAIMDSRLPPVRLATWKAMPYGDNKSIIVQARNFTEAEKKVKHIREQYFPGVLFWRMWRVDTEPQPQQTHAQAWSKRKPMGASE